MIGKVSCPCFVEIEIDSDVELPTLPKGNLCFDFEPNLIEEKKFALDALRERYDG